MDLPQRWEAACPLVGHSPASLADELGDGFTLIESRPHLHTTPGGTISRSNTPAFNA